jgi:protoporphyrinogen oxidase
MRLNFLSRGYENVRDEIRRGSSANPGLFIGGNFISGVSVGDCINYGAVMANNISSYILKSRFS